MQHEQSENSTQDARLTWRVTCFIRTGEDEDYEEESDEQVEEAEEDEEDEEEEDVDAEHTMKVSFHTDCVCVFSLFQSLAVNV